MLKMEKPSEAVRYFDDAARLGVKDADIASDRGLALDLTGDPERAQREYKLALRSEEHTSELQSLMRISYAVFCLKKQKKPRTPNISVYSTTCSPHLTVPKHQLNTN